MSQPPPPAHHRPPNLLLNSNEGVPDQGPPSRPSGGSGGNGTPRSLIPGYGQQRTSPGQSPARGAYAPPDTPGFSPDAAQRLLQPSRHRFRDDDGLNSPALSAYSSRRTSFSSDHGSRDSRLYGANPFNDSRAPSRSGSDDEHVNTQTVSEKYNILPSAGLLLFPEDVEKDDYLHNPSPDDKDRDCDICHKRGLTNLGGLLFVTLGVLALFIAYPVVTFVNKIETIEDPCGSDPDCINKGTIPLFSNVRSGLIDPDTPDSAKTKTAADGTQLQLVFSDEFNTDGRTFYPGDDPYFTAVDIWYGVTQDLEWYDPDAVTTKDGVLEITFDAFQNHGLNYRSGMVQSWNQLCFQGGRLEASISLPGAGDVSGFWPGFWSMGNLGRPGYAASTEGLWPYSYDDVCDSGISPNQSMTDGTSYLPGMRLPACTCSGEDHPNPGKSRSAPEIDVIEASAGPVDGVNIIGTASQSFQVAPFDIWWYPDYDFTAVYDNQVTSLNSYTGGPFQQACSAVTNLNNDWYDDKSYQVFAYEFTPGSDGALTWFVGEDQTWTLDARALRSNGNIGQRMLPYEPLALVMNFGMSNSFAGINFTGIGHLLPATMRFDYVRIYQDPNSQSVTCNPDNYPTTAYINQFSKAYQDPNVTTWAKAGFDWPKNTLLDGCSA